MESEIIEYLARYVRTKQLQKSKNKKGSHDNPEFDHIALQKLHKYSKSESYFSMIYGKSFNDYINITVPRNAKVVRDV